jgi:hypothetical protein
MASRLVIKRWIDKCTLFENPPSFSDYESACNPSVLLPTLRKLQLTLVMGT